MLRDVERLSTVRLLDFVGRWALDFVELLCAVLFCSVLRGVA